MFITRVKAEGLAVNSYLIGSGDEAVVVDPVRDPERFVRHATERCVRIRYILETHRHEDFALGSAELRSLTSAKICRSGQTEVKYCDLLLKSGSEIQFGDAVIRAVETPGHTPDSLSFALFEAGRPGIALAVFCGDTLFSGSCGRIDFGDPEKKPDNAASLYESIHERLLPLGDQALLYPAHGAGSVCGAGISDRDETTVGFERLTNPWLSMDLESFVRAKVAEKHEYAPYFKRMEHWNTHGPSPVLRRLLPEPLDPAAVVKLLDREKTVLVDTRLPAAFASGHVPGSYNIWREGMTVQPGWLFESGVKVYLVPERQEDVTTVDHYLRQIGFDGVAGYLCGGFQAWQNAGRPADQNGMLPVEKLKSCLDSDEIHLIDVREPGEWSSGVVRGADLRFLGRLQKNLPDISQDTPVAVMCNTGLRSGIGVSILLKAGFTEVYNVQGGLSAWKNRGYPIIKPE